MSDLLHLEERTLGQPQEVPREVMLELTKCRKRSTTPSCLFILKINIILIKNACSFYLTALVALSECLVIGGVKMTCFPLIIQS